MPVLLFLAFGSGVALSAPVYSVYGKSAPPDEGDVDYFQTFYFSLPDGDAGNLYLRVFDPESGGVHDIGTSAVAAGLNKTRYSLYGEGMSLDKGLSYEALSNIATVRQGKPILQKDFTSEAHTDDKWVTLGKFKSSQGLLKDGRRYFKIIVEGLSGDDGNIFDYSVSTGRQRNYAPAGIHNFAYVITANSPNSLVATEIAVRPSEGMSSLKIKSFDLGDVKKGSFTFASKYRKIKLKGGKSGAWDTTEVPINSNEQAELALVTFSGGLRRADDVTLYFQDENNRILEIELPLKQVSMEETPPFVPIINYLSECNSIAFGIKDSDSSASYAEYKYQWDFGDGKTEEGSYVVHRYDSIGKYGVELSVRSPRDNHKYVISFHKMNVQIDTPPTAAINELTVVSTGEEVRFESLSDPGTGEIITSKWQFNDGYEFSGQSVSRKFTTPGIYSVQLHVESNIIGLCNSSDVRNTFRVNVPPVAEAGKDIVLFLGEEAILTGGNSYDEDGEIANYDWDFGDGSKGTGDLMKHLYKKPGKYKVTLTVRDDSNVSNSTHSDVVYVTVKPPLPEFKIDLKRGQTYPTKGAVGERLEFSGNITNDYNNNVLDFRWDFGDGKIADGREVRYAFAKPGIHDVTLTITSRVYEQTSPQVFKFKVDINDAPTAVATYEETGPGIFQFDGSKSFDKDGFILHYQWDFGDGVTQVGPTPKHIYRNPGKYKVRLLVSDNSDTTRNFDVQLIEVLVRPIPIADAGINQRKSVGQTVYFDGSNSIDPDGKDSVYIWEFGDGTVLQGETVSHSYSRPGQYTVTLKLLDNNNSDASYDYDTTIVRINHPPVAFAGADKRVSPGQTVDFIGLNSYDPDGRLTSYEWKFNDSFEPIKGEGVRRTFRKSGTYKVTLTVIDDSGTQTGSSQDDAIITVNSTPVAFPSLKEVTSEQIVILDGSESVDADKDILLYKWDLGDGSPPKFGKVITHQYADSGIYPISLTVDDQSGLSNSSDTKSLSVHINRPPVADAGEDRIACTNDIVLFDGSNSTDPDGDLLRYFWGFGNGETGESITATHVFKKPGTYKTTLKVVDSSGLPYNLHRDTVIVEVNEAPRAVAGSDKSSCVYRQVSFDGSASTDVDGKVNRFDWDFGDGQSSSGEKVNHVYTAAGTYHVKLSIEGDNTGLCDSSDSDELIVRVAEGIKADFHIKNEYAIEDEVVFDASPSLNVGRDDHTKWSWSFGDGNSAEGKVVKHRFSTPGDYFVTLNIESEATSTECSKVSVQKLIRINARPVAIAGVNKVTGINVLTLFDGSLSYDTGGSIKEYEWDFGDGKVAQGMQVYHKYSKTGEYSVKLKVTDNSKASNNTSENTIKIRVNESPIPVIESNKDDVCVGEEIVFDGKKSYDTDGNIEEHMWDFGDRQIATGPVVKHQFFNHGVHQVELSVLDDSRVAGNSTGRTIKQINVNKPPIIQVDAPSIACPGASITFSAADSYDEDGNIAKVEWDFGNGQLATGKTVTTTYSKPGNYEVKVAVKDNLSTKCSTASEVMDIRINSKPIASAGPDKRVFIGGVSDRAFFDATQSTDDEPLSYAWDFGDGNSKSGAKVFNKYTAPGQYHVKLTVNDSTGLACGKSTDTLTVIAEERGQ